MTQHRPPSTARVLFLLMAVAARRFLNRLSGMLGGRRRKRKDTGTGGRRATPGKSGLGLILGLVFLFLFLPQAIMLSSQIVAKMAALAQADGGAAGENTPTVPVSTHRYDELRKIQKRVDRGEGRPSEFLDEVRKELQWEVFFEERYRAVDEDGDRAFELNEAGKERLDEMVRAFRERGIDAFRPSGATFWLDSSVWPEPGREPRLLASLGLLLTLLVVSLFVSALGSANQDLGRTEWSLEWLFTFPVGTRTLLTAKILEFTVVNAFAWFTVMPLSLAVLWMSGYGWWAIPLCLFVTLYVNLLLASVRVVTETWLRKNVSLSRLKNLQALFTVVGIVLLYAVLLAAIGRDLPDWFAEAATAVPESVIWLPAAFPVRLAASEALPVVEILGMLALGVLFAVAGSTVSAWVVRDGLLRTGGGAYQGERVGIESGPDAREAVRATGILWKEFSVLRRDRNFMVQTLVIPLLIVGFQIFANPALLEAGGRDFRHGATMAFGIGAYVLMFGGFSILTSEGRSLWLLYTFPQPLISMLRRKALLWTGIGSVYVLAILVIVISRTGRFDPEVLGGSLMALVGIAIYAFVAAGIGVLGTDPLEEEVRRKVRPSMFYLFMLLSSMYAFGIYAPGVWTKVALVVLCSLTAYAIWQKVRDRLPYLLDPTARPPPRIALSDGLIAALAFFAVQGTLALILIAAQDPRDTLLSGGRLLVAFVGAGVVVVAASMLLFWRAGVPDLLETVGLKSVDGRFLSLRALGTGVLFGAAAAGVAVLYLELIEYVPALRELKESALDLARARDAGLRRALIALAVLAAPLFEEFIFRGLVFRGLRRSLPLGGAVVGSAAIFAIVHPPIAAVPVLGLGIAAALSFHRTGLLVAPIVAHMIYNAIVLAVGAR